MNKELRLQVMLQINHPEEYYKKLLKAQGIKIFTHSQLAAFKASVMAVEADLLIQVSEQLPVTSLASVEIDFTGMTLQPIDNISPIKQTP